MATGCKPLLDSDWAAITRLKTPTDSLDASGLLVLLSFVAFASLLAPLGLFTASDAECPAQGSLFFNFPKPEIVSDYYRELTVKEGQRLLPFSAEEFAAIRAPRGGTSFFDQQ